MTKNVTRNFFDFVKRISKFVVSMTKKGHREFPAPVNWKLPGSVPKPSPPLKLIIFIDAIFIS